MSRVFLPGTPLLPDRAKMSASAPIDHVVGVQCIVGVDAIVSGTCDDVKITGIGIKPIQCNRSSRNGINV